MRAFLSHSSKDKLFVREVAKNLGPLQVEFDEATFEYVFNVQAIRLALKRCSLFVYFLSHDSVHSNFIKEEHRAALEGRGAGLLNRIMIFSIDGTSFKELPEWMREINVVRAVSSPKTCARQIMGVLLEQATEEDPGLGLFLGREDEERELRRALAVPPTKTPVFLHVGGHHGIGRRTFLSATMRKLFPRLYQSVLMLTFSPFEDAEDLYRQIYGLHIVASLHQTTEAFRNFSLLERREQVAMIARLMLEMVDNGEMLVIIDEGGVYTDEGLYQPLFSDLLEHFKDQQQPILGFVQTRMMPLRHRSNYAKTFHQYLPHLSKDVTAELLSFSLKEMSVNFTETQIADVVDLLDGHPLNIRFVVNYILNYGFNALLLDSSELVEWKRRRADEFLSKISFNKTESDLIAALGEFQFLASSTVVDALQADPIEISHALRRMQDFCCIERRDDYFHISPPIRDGVTRDSRFERPESWRQRVRQTICDLVDDYQDEDRVQVSIIQTGILAASRSPHPPAFLSELILPSHLLRLARESYDAGKRGLCIELCERAFQMKDRLPLDAHVELCRFWGLSAVRTGNHQLFKKVLDILKAYNSSFARRQTLFLEGFQLRTFSDLDGAESKFLAAWRLGRPSASINRELASLYCKQKRFSEAESYARAAYEHQPTNPFILDIFAETLIGKQSSGLAVSSIEIEDVLRKLQIYGDAPGSSFFLIRDGQKRFRAGDKKGALESITKAIGRTPSLVNPYFIRADIKLVLGDTAGAQEDLAEIKRLLTDAGGSAEGDEGRAQELEIRILVEKRQFRAAFEKIRSARRLSQHVERQVSELLARSIAFEPHQADEALRSWAKGCTSNKYNRK